MASAAFTSPFLPLRAVAVHSDRIAFAGSEEQIVLHAVLPRVQVVVAAARGIELRVRAALHDLSLLHHHDLIGAANRRKPVRDDERGPSLHQIRKALLDHLLRFRVEAGRCFVENQNARLGQNGARNRDALPLAARELHAAFADDRVVFVGERFGELIDARDAAGAHEFFLAGIGPRERDVLADRPVEQKRFLQHNSQPRAVGVQSDRA